MKIVIVGGVAGGMSAATRLRRLMEDAEIIVLERGPHVSFANCGLPYYIGGTIAEQDKLLVQTPAKLRARFNLDVRIDSEVLSIDREAKTISVRDQEKTYEESYDRLVLSTGARPFRPPVQGLDTAENVFTLRDVPDAASIVSFIEAHNVRKASIIGAGFIGLEMAENFVQRGIQVTIIERDAQILPPLDPEMAAPIEALLQEKGITVLKNKTVTALEDHGSRLVMDDGSRHEADLVLMSVGVVPESGLAERAGLALGERKAILVNDRMETSDPSIYAIGDAIAVRQLVSGMMTVIPLASPANRQGRMAADLIAGRARNYKGTLGTSIVKTFELSAAVTGLNEKQLRRSKTAYQAIHTSPPDHASYYPGSKQMTLKLLFNPEDGHIFGAQAVGEKGIDKTIDVLSTAIKAKMTVSDLTELELAYAPPFNSAKSPINLIGYAAENLLDRAVESLQWDEVDAAVAEGAVLIDVRTESEFARGHIPHSINKPLDSLRAHLDELPRDTPLIVTCQVGLRGYLAARILAQKGFTVRNLDGGYKLYHSVYPESILH